MVKKADGLHSAYCIHLLSQSDTWERENNQLLFLILDILKKGFVSTHPCALPVNGKVSLNHEARASSQWHFFCTFLQPHVSGRYYLLVDRPLLCWTPNKNASVFAKCVFTLPVAAASLNSASSLHLPGFTDV